MVPLAFAAGLVGSLIGVALEVPVNVQVAMGLTAYSVMLVVFEL